MEEQDPWALVLRVGRAAGLAPYGSLQQLRVSRRACLYGCMLHIALGGITLAGTVLAARVIFFDGYLNLLWYVNFRLQDLIVWTAVFRGPNKLRDALFILNRLKKISRTIKFNRKTTESKWKVRLIIITLAIAVIAVLTLVLKAAQLLREEIQDPGIVSGIVIIIFHDYEDFFLGLVSLQFILLVIKVNQGMQGVNQGLQQLYTELCPDGDLETNEANHLGAPKELFSGVRFINVKPKMVATLDYRAAQARLRSLSCAYVSTCGLARRLARSSSLLLFQHISFSVMNLLLGIYYVIIMADSTVSNIIMSYKTIINCFLHVSNLILLVAPCHEWSEELENTRFLVSHISSEAASCSDGFRAELDVFYVHLETNQPCYSALGMCTLGRPLLLTVATFIVTYLAVLLGI